MVLLSCIFQTIDVILKRNTQHNKTSYLRKINHLTQQHGRVKVNKKNQLNIKLKVIIIIIKQTLSEKPLLFQLAA